MALAEPDLRPVKAPEAPSEAPMRYPVEGSKPDPEAAEFQETIREKSRARKRRAPAATCEYRPEGVTLNIERSPDADDETRASSSTPRSARPSRSSPTVSCCRC